MVDVDTAKLHVNNARGKAHLVLEGDASDADRELAEAVRFLAAGQEALATENAELRRQIARLEERLKGRR
jgi:hypothetical protein